MLTPDEIKYLIDNDRTSEKKQFARTGERYYDGDHDIKKYRLFYYNADGELVEDNNKPESIQFSWLVGATACAVPGNVGFTVCFKKLDSEGNIINEINTKLTRMKVLEGCEAVEDEIEERYMTDLAGQLYKELDEVKKSVSDGKSKVASAITDKGVATEATDTFDVMTGNIGKIQTGMNIGRVLESTMTTSGSNIKSIITHHTLILTRQKSLRSTRESIWE